MVIVQEVLGGDFNYARLCGFLFEDEKPYVWAEGFLGICDLSSVGLLICLVRISRIPPSPSPFPCSPPYMPLFNPFNGCLIGFSPPQTCNMSRS